MKFNKVCCFAIISFYYCISVNIFSQVVWSKTFGGSDYDFGYSVIENYDGSYLIAGNTLSYGDVEGDLWLFKLDYLGELLWSKTYGGNRSEWLGDFIKTYDNGYVIVGRSSSYNQPGEDLILIKVDSVGNQIWTKTYGEISSIDYGMSLAQTDDGGFIVSGTVDGWAPGSSKLWLLKTDSFGDTLWTKRYGTNAIGFSVLKIEDSSFAILGQVDNWNIWLLKTNLLGDTLWTKKYPMGWGGDYDLQITFDKGFIIGGRLSTEKAGIIKTDSLGNVLWIKEYSGINVNSIQQTSDEGYIITVFTAWDATLLKTNEIGDSLWIQSYGGDSFDDLYSAKQVSDGGYIAVGKTSSFGYGGWDALVLKTDEFGNTPSLVNINDTSSELNTFKIYQNYPNPFNPTTTISYSLPNASMVSLKVYDILGKEVATLVNEEKPSGSYKVEFDGSNLTSGIFLYKLTASGGVGNFTETKKLILLK